MKTPLRFQVTETDCGSVSLINAIGYLFERKQIPAELIRAIYLYTLDCYDEEGNLGGAGTSKEAVEKLLQWISDYSKEKDFGIECEHLMGEDVTLEKMQQCLKQKGVILIRCWQVQEHYSIITKIGSRKAYIFDPYYLKRSEYDSDSQVRIILSKPFEYNRIVSIKRLFGETKKPFSLGKIEKRECVLMYKKKK